MKMKLEAAIKSLTDSVASKEWAYGPAVQAVLEALAAERQRADKAELELIKPLPIGELIQRLEGQTYEKWFSLSYLKAEQVPDAEIKWDGTDLTVQNVRDGFSFGVTPVFTVPNIPTSLPVGEIVAWSGTNCDMGITRDIDFRFFRFDVKPGTKLYAVESSSGASNA